jgi:hypothetical protein
MTDAPTPTELLNQAGRILGLPELIDHNSGALVRDRFIAAALLELAKRSQKPVLKLPVKK